jgi:hypothetical protein
MPIACGDRYILGSNRPRRLLRDVQMLFSSVGFIFGFLPIVLGTFYVLIGRGLADVAKLWLIAASKTVPVRGLEGFRVATTAVLILLALMLSAMEFAHRSMPAVAGTSCDHLVVIGDSISSGLGPNVPAWPVVMHDFITTTAPKSVRVNLSLQRPRLGRKEPS